VLVLKLLIAIPVHNERKYVADVLAKVRSYHDDVLVVDDGSTDGTSEVLAEMAAAGQLHLIRHRVNQGYGQSLIDAFAFADHQGYDWVVTMDCDEQHEPEMIPQFKREIESDRWDLISGSRYLRPLNSDDLPPADRRTINTNITAIVNRLFEWSLTDAFCGFKAHRVSATRKLSLTETGYAFPLQLWPQVWGAGLRVTELPVRLIYNDATRTFGGTLDDAGNRYRHYLGVLENELKALKATRELNLVHAAAAEPTQTPAPAAPTEAGWSPSRLAEVCGCCA
jgi:glycosyltransferase involved in cell wall biosynthesis